MDPTVSVGFVGVGDMGGRIVKLLAAAGMEQTLWARRPEALEEFAQLPSVRIAPALREVGVGASVVGICVWAEPDVEEVVGEIAPQMEPGSVVLIHSTVSSAFCQKLARTLDPLGISVVDAPVSTRLDSEKLLVLAGGDAESFSSCRTVLEAMGEPVINFGSLGAGQRAKLLNNALMAAQVALANDALRVGSVLELDPELLGSALLYGSSSTVSGMRMHRMLAELPADHHAARDWAWKDVHSLEAELEKCQADKETLLVSVAEAGAAFITGKKS